MPGDKTAIPSGVPNGQLPALGARYENETVSIDLARPSDYEIYFEDDWDLISFGFRAGAVRAAFASDNVNRMECAANGLNFIPAGMTVYCCNPSVNGLILNMRIAPGISDRLRDDVKLAGSGVRNIHNVVTPQSPFIGRALVNFVASGAPGGRLAAESIAILSLVEMFTAGQDVTSIAASGIVWPSEFTRVVDFIEDRLKDDLSLQELADVAGMSVFHFARRFKEAIGKSPHAFVMERRVERAKTLLSSCSLSLVDIAAETGFSSQAYFTTAFKKRTGITPGRFRKDASD